MRTDVTLEWAGGGIERSITLERALKKTCHSIVTG